jgi:hypothetical protein
VGELFDHKRVPFGVREQYQPRQSIITMVIKVKPVTFRK